MSCNTERVKIPFSVGEDAEIISFEYIIVNDDLTESPQDLNDFTDITLVIEREDGLANIELSASIDDAANGLFSFQLPIGGLPFGEHYGNLLFELVSGRSFWLLGEGETILFDVSQAI